MAGTIYPGNATPAQVLVGQKYSAGTNYEAVGTMPNNGALGTITPGTAAHAIPAGYTSGGTVAGDANLVASSILTGVSIFDVVGAVIPKYFASGTAATSASTLNFTVAIQNVSGTTTGSFYYLIVNGLTFKPTIILIQDGAQYTIGKFTLYVDPSLQYDNAHGFDEGGAIDFSTLMGGGVADSGSSGAITAPYYAIQNTSPLSVTNSGFTLPFNTASDTVKWFAFA